MLERILANTGAVPEVVTEDAGYWSEDNVDTCESMGIDPYNRCAQAFGYATGRLKHGQQPPPSRGPVPRNLDAKGRMGRKLRSKKGKETYARRKTIVEPVFGQTKEARGFRRFLLRGLEKVNGEWSRCGLQATICSNCSGSSELRAGEPGAQQGLWRWSWI